MAVRQAGVGVDRQRIAAVGVGHVRAGRVDEEDPAALGEHQPRNVNRQIGVLGDPERGREQDLWRAAIGGRREERAGVVGEDQVVVAGELIVVEEDAQPVADLHLVRPSDELT